MRKQNTLVKKHPNDSWTRTKLTNTKTTNPYCTKFNESLNLGW